MRTAALVKEIQARLRAVGNEERRRISTTYFPTAMEVVGVRTPDLREIVRHMAKELRGVDARALLSLVRSLLGGGLFEGRQVAYELLERFGDARRSLSAEDLISLGEGMDNWASVDSYALMVAGPAWREGQLSDAVIDRWSESGDRWWRRAAVVSTVALNLKSRGGTGDRARTLRTCSRAAADEDEMVVKGLSWALRELSKRDPEAVVRFLEDHDEVLAARVKREVRNKLEKGLKNPRS